MKSYDVVVIGSGPGGYVAAIRCAQLGMKTAIVEKYATLGGTCLNVGCIPSKALLDSSHHYEDAVKHFEEHGIDIPGEIKVNLEQMIARKQGVVDQTTKGIQFLMDKNKIDVFEGVGSFSGNTEVSVALTAGGTDTAGIQRFSNGGAIAGAISIPTRYLHQVIEMSNKEDIHNSIRLLEVALGNIDKYDWSFR